MIKKEPVAPAFGNFLTRLQKEQLINGRYLTNVTIARETMMSTKTYNLIKKGLSCNVNQLHAVTNFWRSLLKSDQERMDFDLEVAACMDSDLETYRIRTGVLKP